jgi:hypothetical protein
MMAGARPHRYRSSLLIALITVVLVAWCIALLGFADRYSGEIPDKLCFRSFALAQWPKWIGCAMSAHQDLAGGLIGSAGALLAAIAAWLAVQRQITLASVQNDFAASDALLGFLETLSTELRLVQKIGDAGESVDFLFFYKDDLTCKRLSDHLHSCDDTLRNLLETFESRNANAWSETLSDLRKRYYDQIRLFERQVLEIAYALNSPKIAPKPVCDPEV